MKITPSSLTINQLFGSSNEHFVIPSYQRRYSWRERQIYELIEDIELIDAGDTHLLGSIVCLTGHHTAGLNQLELVDGQQRLTTIAILLECIRQHLKQLGDLETAGDVGRLLNARSMSGTSEPKVMLESLDRDEFNRLVNDPIHDAHATYENRRLQTAFKMVRERIAENSIDWIHSLLYKLQNQALVIRLDVGDAKDAFKLFETINNRGLKLSPTDIIKNFVLGNASRFGSTELTEARKCWARLVTNLDGTDADTFFRYFLIARLKRRVTTSEVVIEFKTLFMNSVLEAAALPDRHLYADEDDSPDMGDEDAIEMTPEDAEIKIGATAGIPFSQFISDIVTCSKAYGELVLGKTGDVRTDRHLRNLRMIKAAQTYGFLMHLRVGGIESKRFHDVLKLTESFVLRRHICRERSNDTEALFARLCSADPKNPMVKVKGEYREASPSDDKFREEFASANYTSNIIERARYCLEQIALSKQGAQQEMTILGSTDVHVEHIIPQKITTKKAKREYGDWQAYLGEGSAVHHHKYVSKIGNLTIFAGTLNVSASNNPFASKKKFYKASSIELTRELAELASFKFKHVTERSRELADLAVSIWSVPN